MIPLPGIITHTRNQIFISVSDLVSVLDLVGTIGMHQLLTTMVTITGIIRAILTGMVAEDIIHTGIITTLIAHLMGIMVEVVAPDIIPDMVMTTTTGTIETTIMARGQQVILDLRLEGRLPRLV